MKKIMFILPLLAIFLMVSCGDDDNTASKYAVTVTVSGSDSVPIASVKNISVVAQNTTTGKKYTATALNNAATFNLPVGTYTFTAAGTYDNVAVEGVSDNVNVIKAASGVAQSVALSLNFAAAKSSLIFKEVYFTGVAQWFWRDGFYELVNNSDTTVYLDGVMLSAVDAGLPEWTAAPSVWLQNGITDAYPTTSYTVYFPGTGKEHPLASGQSVVIATSAQNHSVQHPATSAGDVASPVDLSKAEWEVYITPTSTYAAEIDNPDVPNLGVAFGAFGFDFMPATDGKNALIISRLPAGTTPADYAANADNYQYQPGTTFPKHLMIPRKYVLDAIDIVCSPVNERFKKLQKEDDRSYTFVDNGVDATGAYNGSEYSGRGLRRKVVSITNGVAKFKDTNNSEVDFVTTTTPTPHRTFTSVDK